MKHNLFRKKNLLSYTFMSLNNISLKVAEYQAIKDDFALTFDVNLHLPSIDAARMGTPIALSVK